MMHTAALPHDSIKEKLEQLKKHDETELAKRLQSIRGEPGEEEKYEKQAAAILNGSESAPSAKRARLTTA